MPAARREEAEDAPVTGAREAVRPTDGPLERAADLASISRRRISGAAAYQLVARSLALLLGVAVAAILARSLGANLYGQLALALTMAGIAANVGDFGASQVAQREMNLRPAGRNETTAGLLVLRLGLGSLIAVGLGIAAFLLLPTVEARLMALFVLATVPLGAVAALQAAAQARLRSELTSTVLLVQSAVWLAVVVALVAVDAPLSLYGLGFLGAAIVQGALLLFVTRNLVGLSVRGAGRAAGRLLRLSLLLGLAGLSVTAYYKLDSVLVFWFAGSEANAFYSAAYRFLDVLQLLPITVLSIFLPLWTSLRRRADEGRMRALFAHSVVLSLMIAFPVVTFGVVVAPDVVELIYGSGFAPAGSLLRILLPAFLCICLGYIFVAMVIAEGMTKAYAVAAALVAVGNIVLNVLLLPRYGVAAAAWVTLASEVAISAAVGTIVLRRLRLRLPLVRLLRCALCTAAAVLVLILLANVSIFVTLPLAGAAYALALFATRTLTVGELRRMIHPEEVTAA